MTLHELLLSEHSAMVSEHFETWLHDRQSCPPEIAALLCEAAKTEDLTSRLPDVKFLCDLKKRIERI